VIKSTKTTKKSYVVLKLCVIFMTHSISILIGCTYCWRRQRLLMTTQDIKWLKFYQSQQLLLY